MERFAITHVNKDSLRQLTFANQGRNHYDTREAAEKAMHCFEGDLRSKVLGHAANTLEVRPVDCHEHGDAKGIYFPMELFPVEGYPFSTTCVSCGKVIHHGTAYPPVYADLHGTPWKAYYCASCAAPIVKLQEVTSGTR